MRQLVVDAAAQPVRNVMRNPRMVGVVKDVLSNGSVSGPEFRAVPYSGGSFRVVDAVGVPGMPAGTRAVEFEAVDTGSSRGVYFAASGYATAAAGDTAGVPRVTAGQTWTVSAWVKASVAIAPFFGTRVHNIPNMTGAVLAENSPVKETLPAGVWVRLTHSVSFPEGSPGIDGFMGAQIRFPTTIAIGTTVQVAGLRITTDGSADYVDGSSYNWRWTGTVDASESVGYPEPASYIRNMHPNPGLESSSGSTFWATNSADVTLDRVVGDNPRSGVACARSTRDSTNPGSRASSVYIHTGGTTAWRVTPGGTVSASVHFRPQLAGRFARIRFVFRDTAGATIANSVVADLPVAAGTYTRHSHTQVVPAGSLGAIAVLEVFTSDGSSSVTGERVWMDDCMLVNGPDPGIHCDGNTPGWRWEGAANASTSVGYPIYPPVFHGYATSKGFTATNTVGAITGARVGDVLLAFVAGNALTESITPPAGAGWTQIGDTAGAAAGRLRVFATLATTTDQAGGTWTWPASHNHLVSIGAWGGAALPSAAGMVRAAGGALTVVAPSQTSIKVNSLLVDFAFFITNGIAPAWPSSMTVRAPHAGATADGVAAEELVTLPGPSGTRTFTASTTTAPAGITAAALVLEPL